MLNFSKKCFLVSILFFTLISSVNSELVWEINIDDQEFSECLPSFRSTVWSNCTETLQNRSLIDLNSCVDDRIEKRICDDGNDEISNMLLNAKNIPLEKVS